MEELNESTSVACRVAELIGTDRFDLWLEDQSSIEVDGSRLIVGVGSPFLRDQVQRHLGALLTQAARTLLGDGATALVRVAETALKAMPISAVDENSRSVTQSALSTTATQPQPSGEIPQSFQSLIIGNSNELAAESARLVASGRPAGGPLVIWGPPGSGKTHLLKAMQRDFRSRFPRSRCVSLTAEHFVGQYVEAYRGGGLPSFRMKYRGASLLIIDDLHFMAGKKATLEELHHTIDRVSAAGGQVVLASVVDLAQIPNLSEELRSRLRAGLDCEIRRPDFAMRLEIARQRCQVLNLAAPERALRQLAAGINTGARELIGAIHRLQAKHELLGTPIDADLIEATIADVNRQTTRPVGIEEIQRVVGEYFGVDAKMLRSSSRAKSASQPRMLAMWLARKYTQAGWREIGDHFGGRSHSTVISAHRRVEQQIESHTRVALAGGSCELEEAVVRIETALRTA